MDYTRSADGAALGARLRRLSETIDRDATRIYATLGVRFEQRWYGVLNQLALNGPMTAGALAEALRITHASISESVGSLRRSGVITSSADRSDGRRRRLALTKAGVALVKGLTPLWAALNDAAIELNAEAGNAISILDRLDDALGKRPLFIRVTERLANYKPPRNVRTKARAAQK